MSFATPIKKMFFVPTKKNILPNQKGCGELSSPGAVPSNSRCGLLLTIPRIFNVQNSDLRCAISDVQLCDCAGAVSRLSRGGENTVLVPAWGTNNLKEVNQVEKD